MNTKLDVSAPEYNFANTLIHPPPKGLRDFVNTLVEESQSGKQNRSSRRYRLGMEVPAVPLDKKLRAVGDPFVAFSRNISTGGICLVHTSPVAVPFLLLQLVQRSGVAVQLVLKVLHCRRHKRFFEIGGTFVTRCGL